MVHGMMEVGTGSGTGSPPATPAVTHWELDTVSPVAFTHTTDRVALPTPHATLHGDHSPAKYMVEDPLQAPAKQGVWVAGLGEMAAH